MKALVIVASGLQPSFLGCYGNEWIDTPHLDALAAQSAVFDQHFADHADADGTRRAWRTGRYHLPLPDDVSASLSVPSDDLLGLLRQRTVGTFLVSDSIRPPPTEFAAGWDRIFSTQPQAGEDALEMALEAAGDALDELASQEHWLLWLDLATLLPPWIRTEEYQDLYFDAEDLDEEEEGTTPAIPNEPLTPWTDTLPDRLDPADERSWQRLQRSYAGQVTYLDAGLGLLLDELRGRDLLDEMVLIVTADYGLPLGEHGAVGAALPWLHTERVHLPLLVRLPGAAEAGRRVSALTQSVDLLPTVLDAFGSKPAYAQGHNLLPLCRGEIHQVRAYACAGACTAESLEWVCRTPQWSFLLPVGQVPKDPPRPCQLYVQPDDRWEVNNVYQHHPELTQHFEEILRAFATASRQSGPFQPPSLRDLKDGTQATAVAPTEPG
jgi:arylsulfatase A-like enzyme